MIGNRQRFVIGIAWVTKNGTLSLVASALAVVRQIGVMCCYVLVGQSSCTFWTLGARKPAKSGLGCNSLAGFLFGSHA